ncbi:MAG: putative rane protein [Dehalococcoidia bacterium]|nr:putative rane protein [Dehalococcoidia bacterium]
MKRSSLVFIALVLLLAFLPFAPAFATPASAQSLYITPATGSAGTLVTYTATFTAPIVATTYTVYFAGTTITSGTLGIGGTTITGSFSVPSGVTPGSNVVYVTMGTQTATAYFEVLKGVITLSASEGVVGSRVTVNGSRFSQNTTITVYFDGEAQGSRTTSTSGTFTHPLAIPESPAGTHEITAGTSSYDLSDAVQFTVKPSLAEIVPTSGGAFTLITITGKGFNYNDNAIDVFLGPTKIGTVQSDDRGTIASKQVGIGEFPFGAWDVKATDKGGNSATAESKFTVKPAAAISPTGGNVSSPVKVSGTGFLANTAISVTYDTIVLNPAIPIRTAEKGTFSGNFVAPKSKAGAHTVAISDGSNSLSFTWTMESDPPPVPLQRSPLSGKSIGALSKQSPVFAWGEVTDPSGVVYDFQIAKKDPTFASPVLAKENLTTASYALSPVVEALERGLYYWRVRAIDGAGTASAWATPWTVQIGWPIPIWALVLLALLALAIIVLLVIVISRSMVARV